MMTTIRKFFIMSTEFDKNISDWSYDCTDHKNDIDFFMRLVKWPKIDVKKCQNLIFKVDFNSKLQSGSFQPQTCLGLKMRWLKSHRLKSQGLKIPGLKLGVENSRVEIPIPIHTIQKSKMW